MSRFWLVWFIYTVPVPTTWFKFQLPWYVNYEQTSLLALQSTNHHVNNRRASWSVTNYITFSNSVSDWSLSICYWAHAQTTKCVVVLPPPLFYLLNICCTLIMYQASCWVPEIKWRLRFPPRGTCMVNLRDWQSHVAFYKSG